MNGIEHQRDGYVISTDKAKLDVPMIHDFISNRSYWGGGRPLEVTEKTIANSLCFGVYEGERQVGFARVVTDYATFGWVADVFILESHRGRGLSKWLVECIVSHPDLRDLKQLLLGTRNAHELYIRYGGFQPLPKPQNMLTRRKETWGTGDASHRDNR